MLSCKEITRRIASGELEEAGLWRRLAARAHLLMCRHCRKFEAQMRAIGEGAKRAFGNGGREPDGLQDLKKKILEGRNS
jgi:anti-sigma factor ChrR (cupin superfamily)